jgi:hypothetical protein
MNDSSHTTKGLTKEPVPLEDGTYKGLRYGYTLEIGTDKFATREGIRCTRKYCGGPSEFTVSNGVVTENYEKAAASILAPTLIGAGLAASPGLYNAYNAQINPSILNRLGLNTTDWAGIGRQALGGAAIGGAIGLGGYLGGRATNFLSGNNKNFVQKVDSRGQPVGEAKVKRRNFLPGYLAGTAGTYMLLNHLARQLPKSASEDLFALAEEMEQRTKKKVKTNTRENGPKGMPENASNDDYTDPIYPEQSKVPDEVSWSETETITGSGDGPTFGS